MLPSPEKALGFEMQTVKSGGFRSTAAPVGRETPPTILRRFCMRYSCPEMVSCFCDMRRRWMVLVNVSEEHGDILQ